MMRRFQSFSRRAALISAAASLALAACADAPLVYLPSAPTFEGPPVWQMAADQIRIVEGPDVKAPDPAVSARLAATPAEVARRLAKQRLRADPGARGEVVFTIERAEATEEYLPRKSGVTAIFTKDPEAKLNVAFAVSIDAFDPTGAPRGTARAEASASSTLLEGADEDERRKLWERLLNDAAMRLDAELQKQVPVGLGAVARIN